MHTSCCVLVPTDIMSTSLVTSKAATALAPAGNTTYIHVPWPDEHRFSSTPPSTAAESAKYDLPCEMLDTAASQSGISLTYLT